MNGVGEGDGRYGSLRGHLWKVRPAGAAAAHTVLVLGDDQSTTDDEPEQMSSGSEAELIELLQAGMDEETQPLLDSGWWDPPESGAVEEEPATESESGTILRLLLESMRSGSEDESDGDDDEIARIDHDSPRLEELRVN